MEELMDNLLELEDVLNKYADKYDEHIYDIYEFLSKDVDEIGSCFVKWFSNK